MNNAYLARTLLVSLLTLAPFASQAQETTTTTNETKASIDDVSGMTNKTPGEDIDNTITNNYLRALTGSKSRWSIASQFNYMGGTIDNAFGAARPNITEGAAIPDASMLQGQISAKYNINSANSIMAGTGVDWVTPFQGGPAPANYNRKFDVFNPYLIYQYLYRWAGIQSALQVSPTLYTQTSTVDQGYTFQVASTLNNVYEIAHSGASVGLYLTASDNPYFDKSGMQNIGGHFINVTSTQSDYSFGIEPYAEYQLNNTFNLRTVFNFWNYDHWLANPRGQGAGATLIKEPWQQSVGVGIKVTRDVFLYPNVQFLPEQIRSDMTNVALTSVINIF